MKSGDIVRSVTLTPYQSEDGRTRGWGQEIRIVLRSPTISIVLAENGCIKKSDIRESLNKSIVDPIIDELMDAIREASPTTGILE